jgi:adenylate kinase
LKLQQRVDDTPTAIRKRLKLYHAQTEPVLDWYRAKGLVVTVDAHDSIHNVYQSVLEQLEQHSPWLFSKSSKK